MKEIIFYCPRKASMAEISGENIRPFRMISAFEEMGFRVHKIIGDVPERKNRINNIKKAMLVGKIKPAFVYIESTNLPLPLSTPGQKIPAFFLDLNFLYWLKKKGVRISLFYRDLYWKFDAWWKRQGVIRGCLIWPFYYYELYQYVKITDLIFCPSVEFAKIIQTFRKSARCIPLPPGCDIHSDLPLPKINPSLNLFYVGGCKPPTYDLSILFLACKKLKKNVHLTVCTRKDEWNLSKKVYKNYIGDNVTVVHESGVELRKRYLLSHISILPIHNDEYRALAMPLKLFEAIGYNRPIIAGTNCAAGRFVEANGIGWVTDESVENLVISIEKILEKPDLLNNAIINIKKLQPQHTWQARAISVAKLMEKTSQE